LTFDFLPPTLPRYLLVEISGIALRHSDHVSSDYHEDYLCLESIRIYLTLMLASAIVLLTASVSGQTYRTITVQDGGTIRGTVKWDGALPRVPTLAISKDPQNLRSSVAQNARSSLERILIGPQSGVANTVIFLKSIGSGKAMDIPAQRQFLDQRTCRYEPHILLVPGRGNLADEELRRDSAHRTHGRRSNL